MNKLLCGFLGALALCVVASPSQAASAPEAPVSIAVFHPGEQAATLTTVQYNRHYRPHYDRRSFRHHGRHFARHGYHRGPIRRY